MSESTPQSNSFNQIQVPKLSTLLGITSHVLLIQLLLLLAIPAVDQVSDLFLDLSPLNSVWNFAGFLVGASYFCVISWASARLLINANLQSDSKGQIMGFSLAVDHGSAYASQDIALQRMMEWLPRVYPILGFMGVVILAFQQGQYWLLSLVLVPVFWAFILYKRHKWTEHWTNKGGAQALLINMRFWFIFTAFAFVLLTLWAVAHPFSFGWWFKGLGVVFIGLANLTLGPIVIVYLIFNKLNWSFWPFRKPYPVLTSFIITAAAVHFLVNFILWDTDNHPLRVQKLTSPQPFENIQEATELFSPDINKPRPPVFVISEGGGIRAAYFSALYLAMATDLYGADQKIFSITGASGGTVGNTIYLAALKDLRDGISTEAQQTECTLGSESRALTLKTSDMPLTCRVLAILRNDFLSPVLTSYLHNDLLYRVFPIPVAPWNTSRGEYLERTFEREMQRTCNKNDKVCEEAGLMRNIMALYDNKSDWFPVNMGTTTLQNSGFRAVVAPFPIKPEVFSESFDLYSLMGCYNHDEGAKLECDLSLSTMAVMSSRFPYVTPAATFESAARPGVKERLIDAGYFDNYGAHITRDLMNHIYRSQLLTGTRPVVVVLKNSTLSSGPERQTFLRMLSNHRAEPYHCSESMGLSEITTPIQGITSVYSANTQQSVTDLLKDARVLSGYFVPALYESQSNCGSHEEPQPPLGWSLSAAAQFKLEDAVLDRLGFAEFQKHKGTQQQLRWPEDFLEQWD